MSLSLPTVTVPVLLQAALKGPMGATKLLSLAPGSRAPWDEEMGTTEQWVAARDSAEQALQDLHADRLFGSIESAWSVWRVSFEPDVDKFEERARRIWASGSPSAWLFLWLQDSDFAAVLCVDAHGGMSRAVLRADAAGGYKEGRAFLDRIGQQDDPIAPLAAWSANGPRELAADDLRAALRPESPVVDDDVLGILGALGLGAPSTEPAAGEGLVMPLEGKTRVGGQEVDMRDLPYLIGTGRDAQGNSFVGVWRRGEAGPPIERFAAGDYRSAHLRVLQLSGIEGAGQQT